MKSRKGYHRVLTAKIRPVIKEMKWHRWQVKIEGTLAAPSARDVKQRIFEMAQPLARKLPGAATLKVGTGAKQRGPRKKKGTK